MDIPRISVHDFRRRWASGLNPLLVCAYDDDARFREMELDGAISWSEFQSRLPSLGRDQEIAFYCA